MEVDPPCIPPPQAQVTCLTTLYELYFYCYLNTAVAFSSWRFSLPFPCHEDSVDLCGFVPPLSMLSAVYYCSGSTSSLSPPFSPKLRNFPCLASQFYSGERIGYTLLSLMRSPFFSLPSFFPPFLFDRTVCGVERPSSVSVLQLVF